MEWFKTLLIVLQVISALGVILLVLLQQGKGADSAAQSGFFVMTPLQLQGSDTVLWVNGLWL